MRRTTGAYGLRVARFVGVAVVAVVVQGAGAAGEPHPYAEPFVAAGAAIVKLLGEEFFQRYVTPQSAEWYPPDPTCGGSPGPCPELVRSGFTRVVFRLRMPQYRFVDAIIQCVVDPDGRASQVFGAPDCVGHPGYCEFPIDEIAAGDIAQKAGLEPGIEAWTYHFIWNAKFQRYIWSVSTALSRAPGISHGRILLIDGSDGRVLGRFDWTEQA